MKKMIFLPLLLGLGVSIQTEQLIGAAGESRSGTTVQIAYSLGEPAVQTLPGAVVLTQGFLLTLSDSYPGLYEWEIFEAPFLHNYC